MRLEGWLQAMYQMVETRARQRGALPDVLLTMRAWGVLYASDPVPSAIPANLIALRDRQQLRPGRVIHLDAIGYPLGAGHSLRLAGDQYRKIRIGRLGRFHPSEHG